MKRLWIAALCLMAWPCAQAQKTLDVPNDADENIKIWDNTNAPHSNEETRDEVLNSHHHFSCTSETRLYIYKADPSRATGQAVVVCPGGGYSAVCISHEGFEMAKYFQSLGVTALVLKYRLPNNGHKIVPLEDAQAALRYARKHAKQLHIDPKQVGICGSSAGGHLAAYTSTFTPDEEKPAFSILFYPVITGDTWYTHQGTFANLLGPQRTPQEQRHYSLQHRVTTTTPPTLLLLADDDRVVPTISSILYYKALKAHGVKAAMHIFPSGGHGWAGHADYKYDREYKQAIADFLQGLAK